MKFLRNKKMKRTIRLTESDLTRIVRRVIQRTSINIDLTDAYYGDQDMYTFIQ
jgi:hypothetical protein